MKALRAEIGVAILVGVAILIALCMLIIFAVPWRYLFFVGGIPISLAFCVFAGVALYISDRKSFLIRRSGDRYASVFIAILGLALIVESIIDGILNLSWTAWAQLMGWGPPSWEGLMILVSRFAFSGLAFLFGVLLLFDYGKIVEDKRVYQPSVRRLDVETQTKYPRVLFAKYAQQYPHNPESVLEWHIHKKAKEGKTRDQAVKELRNVGGRSI